MTATRGHKNRRLCAERIGSLYTGSHAPLDSFSTLLRVSRTCKSRSALCSHAADPQAGRSGTGTAGGERGQSHHHFCLCAPCSQTCAENIARENSNPSLAIQEQELLVASQVRTAPAFARVCLAHKPAHVVYTECRSEAAQAKQAALQHNTRNQGSTGAPNNTSYLSATAQHKCSSARTQ